MTRKVLVVAYTEDHAKAIVEERTDWAIPGVTSVTHVQPFDREVLGMPQTMKMYEVSFVFVSRWVETDE